MVNMSTLPSAHGARTVPAGVWDFLTIRAWNSRDAIAQTSRNTVLSNVGEAHHAEQRIQRLRQILSNRIGMIKVATEVD